MTQSDLSYRAYLLRLWRSPGSGWRISLEDARSGERSLFASLAELVAHLEHLTNGSPLATPTTADASDK
jgi:hypothetical protein